MAREASLRAVRRFLQYLDELPTMWRPGREWQMRFWAIDDEGQVTRVPAQALEGFGKRVAKDTTAFAAAVWCKRHQPAAIIFASECWVTSWKSDDEYRKMLAREHETPDMADPDNRRRMAGYGCEIFERLMIYGEAHARPPTFQTYDLIDGKIGPRQSGELKDYRFAGVLDGSFAFDPPFRIVVGGVGGTP